MKNYKYLIPVGLIALMGIGVYSTVFNAAEKNTEYNDYVKKARADAKQEIIEEAEEYYAKALKLKDTLELRMEIGNVYVANGQTRQAVAWGEDLVDRYPENSEAYEFLLKQYIEQEAYAECFSLRDQAEARKAKSQKFDEMMRQVDYKYEFGYNSYQDVSVYSNGMCAVQEDGLWGYADMEGNTKIPLQFAWAGPFSTDEIAPVQDENGEFYYISGTGNKRIDLEGINGCTALGVSVNGIFPAAAQGTYAYYDENLKKIAGDYKQASTMSGSIGAVETEDGWNLVNEKGEKITDELFDSIVMDEKGVVFRNDRIFAEEAAKYFMLDETGKKVEKQTYDAAKIFLSKDGYAAVESGMKWGFIDKDGKMMIEPQYDDAHSFSNGYAAIKANGKWGFINTDGDLVIEPQFSEVKDFNEQGNVFVQSENQWVLLKLLRNNYK